MHQELANILKQSGYSLTKPRQHVFMTLWHATESLKTGEIARRTPEVDRASVYRTLELFASLNITTTTLRGWTPFTELADPFKPHHHHLRCTNCDTIEEIASDRLEAMLTDIATHHNFSLRSHVVELTGLCAACGSIELSRSEPLQ